MRTSSWPFALARAFILSVLFFAFSAVPPPGGRAAHAEGTADNAAAATAILGIGPADRQPADGPLTLGIGDVLLVRLDGTERLDPGDWTLFLNGHAIPDLAGSAAVDDASHGLLFKLTRTDKNKDAWAAILGSPNGLRDISVAVTRTDQKDAPRLQSADKSRPATFELDTLPIWRLLLSAAIAAALLIFFVWAAVRTTLLRDNFLPQLPVRFRTFSLGRCQMAFWFLLIAISFVFLYFLLWDDNTLNAQALTLMGISAATGLGAIVANTSRIDSLDKIQDELKAAGFVADSDYDECLKQLSAARNELTAIKAAPPAPETAQRSTELAASIQEAEDKIAAFHRSAKDYLSGTVGPDGRRFRPQGILSDIVDDNSGATLHRLQLVCWTVILGAVFVLGIYRDLTMPEFSATLLALMAVTGGAYVGFKFPEKA